MPVSERHARLREGATETVQGLRASRQGFRVAKSQEGYKEFIASDWCFRHG